MGAQTDRNCCLIGTAYNFKLQSCPSDKDPHKPYYPLTEMLTLAPSEALVCLPESLITMEKEPGFNTGILEIIPEVITVELLRKDSPTTKGGTTFKQPYLFSDVCFSN